jgi:nucleotide-binding universal stress UspA family protein
MKVLIAIDCSCFAIQVLEYVTRRTWTSHSEFRLITVVESHAHWDTKQQLLHQCQVILDDRIKYLAKKLPESQVTGEVIEGSASTFIAEAAQEWHADLIVIGSHGDTGVRQAHIGSVAAAVVNHAPCTVEVVKVRATKPQEKTSEAKLVHS